jgi:hypothetical protein
LDFVGSAARNTQRRGNLPDAHSLDFFGGLGVVHGVAEPSEGEYRELMEQFGEFR